VTHNPELTRYATRVVYMHDGAIVQDEQKDLGEIAPTARRVMYTIPVTTEEDDLEGVSALMNAVPGSTKVRESSKSKKKKNVKSNKGRRSAGRGKKS
ncbi:MAG TPA: hypothetical protein VMR45_01550, partial [Patescibacteria group bacterium]|nr:hypothetical protein [Patescibacteria group bacterium]